MDRLTKLAKLYVNEVIRLHGAIDSVRSRPKVHIEVMAKPTTSIREQYESKYNIPTSNRWSV